MKIHTLFTTSHYTTTKMVYGVTRILEKHRSPQTEESNTTN